MATRLDSGDLSSLSCPSASMCVAVDGSGDVVVGVRAEQLRTLLLEALVPTRGRSRIAAIERNGGYSRTIDAPTTGRMVVSWYAALKGTRLERKTSRTQLIATGNARFVNATGPVRLKVTLTQQGRRLLKHAK
jgi:hypothetical protein